MPANIITLALAAAGGGAFARFAQQRQWQVVLANVPKFMNKKYNQRV